RREGKTGGEQREGQERLSPPWVVRELASVPAVMGEGAWRQVGDRVDGEGQAGGRPREQRPAAPFQDLPEVVGARDPLEEPSPRDAVAAGGLLTQRAQAPVGLTVDPKTGDEEKGPGQE